VYLMTFMLASLATGSFAIWAGVLTGAAAMATGSAAASSVHVSGEGIVSECGVESAVGAKLAVQ
jgi:hypothetical protein